MKTISILLIIATSYLSHAQSLTGTWKTVDDNDGKTKSHILLTEENGVLTGKVVKLLGEDPDVKCKECDGAKRNQPILGMQVVWGLDIKNNKEASGGSILDPEKGKVYRCKIKLRNPNTLEVRGYIGTPLFGRSQKWYRVDS